MRDLEIRGAGNILGSQQSGHITAVGFELYCQLLQQSVKRLKGEKVERRVEVTVSIDFLAMNPGEERAAEREKVKPEQPKFDVRVPRSVASSVDEDEPNTPAYSPQTQPKDVGRVPAYLPFGYIPDTRQRIIIYRKLAQLSNSDELNQLKSEIRDRFGSMPKPVERLLRVAELKVLAAPKNVTSIETRDDKLMFTRNGSLITLGGKYPRLAKRTPDGRLGEMKMLLKAL